MATPPPFEIDETATYRVDIDTDKGPIVLELDPKLAPNSVNNFVSLALSKYFDATMHAARVCPGGASHRSLATRSSSTPS